ncbi:MAG TPA: TadE/TadG family type IV pilus assembly protein [Pseudolabrys sp.]|nr:TadE/TadG family type IV pilus assembly protein [Pseudolabrys sp.]
MKFRSALQSFRLARAGNVAITFAFATIPVIVGIGSAVDYSKANQVKVAMQAALDSTALMISKEAAKDSTDGTLQTKAAAYFDAMFRPPLATSHSITASYYPDGGTRVVIDGSANVSTSFLGLIGVTNITVHSSSTVRWGSTRLRVALVLDNTGSMKDNDKIVALRTATANLLTQLKNAAQTDGDVYVSIIPFMKDVNLGPANWNSDWIYWGTKAQDATLSDATSWDAKNGTCSAGGYTSRSSCVSHSSCSISSDNSQSSCTADGTCSLSGFNTSGACTAAGSCSLSSYTSQSTCTGAGTCSLSGYTSSGACTAAGTCSISGHNSMNGCQSAGVCSNPGETSQGNCTGLKACTKSQYTSKTQCQNNHGVWGFGTWTAGVWTPGVWTATPGTWTAATWTAGVWSGNTWTPANHSTWNGCVMDRGLTTGPDTTNNYDTNVAQPDPTRNASLYAAEQYSYCSPTDSPALNPVMGLSYNWDAMNTMVAAMAPGGSTNQAIGLQLGWMSLVGVGPFTAPPKDPNYTYSDVIILLTDGLNTQDRWYGDGVTVGSSDDQKIDAREQANCNNINAGGVTLYTIQVNTGHDATSTLLQNCAGTAATATTAAVYPDPSKFFLLTSSDAIVTTFQSIGTKLSNLYVAQ